MATVNPFDLLNDDAEDPSQLIAAEQRKAAAVAPPPKKSATAAAPQKQNQIDRMPTKPPPPAQAVREARTENNRGGGRGGGRGYGRGRGGFNRDFANNENSYGISGVSGGPGLIEGSEFGKPSERRGGIVGGRSSNRGGGGRRSGFNDEVADGERHRRPYERRSGTGRGNEIKREGAGRGNWGIPTDEIAHETEEVNESEKRVEKPLGEEDAGDGTKEVPADESEEKEEDKEMTLEEYEKLLEEKRKALQALKTEERKVDVDKEFGTMQPLSSKKSNDDVFFIKLGSEKDKRKEAAEKEERAKKSVSINEFLKPAEGEKYYNPSGRGRGRGRGRGMPGGHQMSVSAPSIEDPGQFPTLGAK